MGHIRASPRPRPDCRGPASADFMPAGQRARRRSCCRRCASPGADRLRRAAMNVEMWSTPPRNATSRAASDGVAILGPASGGQPAANRDGRMIEAAELYAEVLSALAPKILEGRRVLVTRPDLRTDRHGARITNQSSGKMGYAVAQAAAEAGARSLWYRADRIAGASVGRTRHVVTLARCTTGDGAGEANGCVPSLSRVAGLSRRQRPSRDQRSTAI